jgi:hypothetical protein
MTNVLVAAAVVAAISLVTSESAIPEDNATMPVQACRPVPGTTLEQFYPVMPGWTRGQPQSETDTQESVSRTTVDYDRRTETISVELMDSCRNADVLLMMRETLKQFPPGGRGTTQRHTTVNGFPAYEEFTAESGHGELHVLVADRFMVKVTVETSDLRTLQNATQQIPMQKLALAR